MRALSEHSLPFSTPTSGSESWTRGRGKGLGTGLLISDLGNPAIGGICFRVRRKQAWHKILKPQESSAPGIPDLA